MIPSCGDELFKLLMGAAARARRLYRKAGTAQMCGAIIQKPE